MTRILMVCLGNICRSPLAHGILESKLPPQQFFIDSAGTASYHIGASPDERSIKIAKKHNIDISHQAARQFKPSDFEYFDIIYAMDQSNYQHLYEMAQSSEDRSKLKLILKENPHTTDQNVPDPYYGELTDFQKVFDILEETCSIISNRLTEINKI